MKIGIYGGTFNPPHKGHIKAAETAIKALGLDELLIIPCFTPPHKEVAAEFPESALRLEMCRLAFSHIEECRVSDMEIKRGGISYTVDTLARLKAERPDDTLVLLMGTDMILSIEKWKDFERIMRLAELGVFARADGDTVRIIDFSRELEKKYGARIAVVENDAVEISSSEIREKLKNRQGVEFLDEKVYGFILKNRLYGARANFDWMREKAHAMLKTRRIPHVLGCEEEAVRLARRWGADENEAREAGILHDITKKDDLQQQLILCKKYGIMLDESEQSEVKLLHSKTGAGIAGDLFASSPDVCSAIFWHTTGKEDMSLLEKIIYMADYIEPTRNFEGVDKLRELAYSDLNKSIILGYEMSIEDLVSRGIVPHARTEMALKWLLEH